MNVQECVKKPGSDGERRRMNKDGEKQRQRNAVDVYVRDEERSRSGFECGDAALPARVRRPLRAHRRG